jgi:hypothetical protein
MQVLGQHLPYRCFVAWVAVLMHAQKKYVQIQRIMTTRKDSPINVNSSIENEIFDGRDRWVRDGQAESMPAEDVIVLNIGFSL